MPGHTRKSCPLSSQSERAYYCSHIINFHKARALRHTSALSRYNARSLRHQYKRAQSTIHFIKEIKKLFPRTLLSYISTWDFLRTLEKCEKHSPHVSRVLNKIPCAYITQQWIRRVFYFFNILTLTNKIEVAGTNKISPCVVITVLVCLYYLTRSGQLLVNGLFSTYINKIVS